MKRRCLLSLEATPSCQPPTSPPWRGATLMKFKLLEIRSRTSYVFPGLYSLGHIKNARECLVVEMNMQPTSYAITTPSSREHRLLFDTCLGGRPAGRVLNVLSLTNLLASADAAQRIPKDHSAEVKKQKAVQRKRECDVDGIAEAYLDKLKASKEARKARHGSTHERVPICVSGED